MFTTKTNKVHSVPVFQSKTLQQPSTIQHDQPDLQQLSSLIQQVSSQINLMLSQQQQQQQQQQPQQKNSENTNGRDRLEEQPTCTYHMPPCHASHYPSYPVCRNNNNNNMMTCMPQYHYPSLSHSLSSLVSSAHYPPLQQSSTCSKDLWHQRQRQHLHCCNYDPYMSNILCSCQHQHYHTPGPSDSINPTISSSPPPSTKSSKMTNVADNTMTTTTLRNSLGQFTTGTRTTRTKRRSPTDPLPPVPDVNDVSNGNDITTDDHVAHHYHPSSILHTCADISPPPPPRSSCSYPATAAITTENLPSQQQRLSWTEVYRQELLAKQDALISPQPSAFDTFHSPPSSPQQHLYSRSKKHDYSHLRNWWQHNKLKWIRFKKRTITPDKACV
ncbi:uncharacterized protein BX664DRAFT_327729 [Halteromyces radiatus]|uniref:uncharacterized protein n=1 Tax=Halteromyces radiatus TaxID=101107 RepID=UPI00221EC97B|nr:uncharacterized protein BX664DRAFT_327729 [Halteromyces radiatus]KAI8092620.1 hypothetical protein BX664DRAFT_327729 [Halteromyces radiatus]